MPTGPRLTVCSLLTVLLAACGGAPPADHDTSAPIPLPQQFAAASVAGSLPAETPDPLLWRFDGTGTIPPPDDTDESTPEDGEVDASDAPLADTEDRSGVHADTWGFRAVAGVDGLAVQDGRLVARTTDAWPLLVVPVPDDLDPDELLHAIELRLSVSAGTELGIAFLGDEVPDLAELLGRAQNASSWWLTTALTPGDDARTYTVAAADSKFRPSFPFGGIGHIVIRPTDAAEAELALESVRIVGRKEHLAGIDSGLGWHGLSDVYRETLVTRAPERVTWRLTLPDRPWLDLSLGTVEGDAVTFAVLVGAPDADGETVGEAVLRRTLTTPNRWEDVAADLSGWAGREVELTLALDAERPGTPGFWGGAVLRSRGARPVATAASPARGALAARPGAGAGARQPPRGVILILADTLRRDHLTPYGYARDTAPTLARLAAEGALFEHGISQGTWTKVSVPSILTSLYPTTHGIVDIPDRIPASVTTVAETFRAAGYATFATSSVPFTGKLTNLHQGVEVLHESESLPDVGHSGSKTARAFVDRTLDWIERHRDGPFFVFLHVFDPHSPFEPYAPYDARWAAADGKQRHTERVDQVSEHIADEFLRKRGLPSSDELELGGVDAEAFVGHELDWYDGSIRAMDAEVARLLERLDELGLGDDTLVAFVSDHGEEFLEHGRHWHGQNTYGPLVNVPLMLWWPGVVPAGAVVDETVMSIDLVPTLLDLARLPAPPGIQGQSLVPLLVEEAGGDVASTLGFRPRPAIAERRRAPSETTVDPLDVESVALVWEGWKLVRNGERPEDWPEFELYEQSSDPLDLTDVAAEHPEVVARLAELLEAWEAEALAARETLDVEAGDVSPEQLEELRALGYVR